MKTSPDAVLASRTRLQFQDWGLVDYSEALQRQLDLVEKVICGDAAETVVFCSHPAVVTLGRGTKPGDVWGWSGPIVEINRGGRATYHGPNQIVAYPIVNHSHGSRNRDLHRYLRNLEAALIDTCSDMGITSYSKDTGVWIGDRKVASIGIGVRRWVTFHGLALNVDYDPMAFQGMKPCGFSTSTMISLEETLGHAADRDAVKLSLQQHLARRL